MARRINKDDMDHKGREINFTQESWGNFESTSVLSQIMITKKKKVSYNKTAKFSYSLMFQRRSSSQETYQHYNIVNFCTQIFLSGFQFYTVNGPQNIFAWISFS